MQTELTELQPQLVNTVAEVEELMKRVAKEKVSCTAWAMAQALLLYTICDSRFRRCTHVFCMGSASGWLVSLQLGILYWDGDLHSLCCS